MFFQFFRHAPATTTAAGRRKQTGKTGEAARKALPARQDGKRPAPDDAPENFSTSATGKNRPDFSA